MVLFYYESIDGKNALRFYNLDTHNPQSVGEVDNLLNFYPLSR